MSDIEMDIDLEDNLLLGNDSVHSSNEEGEITDSDNEQNEATCQTNKDGSKNKMNENKSLTANQMNELNNSLFGEKQLTKMEERAKKFGLEDTAALYDSLGVGEESEEHRHVCLDTIHMHGTQDMKTNDVFQYFCSHKPLYLEWVSDSSCNIVWPDDISAAKALVFYSKEGNRDEAPSGKWRLGVKHPKADKIFLRFAKRSDKKVSGKEKLKVLSKKYKDIDACESGILSKSMKDQLKSIEIDSCGYIKNPWGELCQSWGINDSQEVFGVSNYKNSQVVDLNKKKSVKERIGKASMLEQSDKMSKSNFSLKMRLGKRSNESRDYSRVCVLDDSNGSDESDCDDYHQQDDSDNSDDEWKSRSKIPRMRMHADDEEEKIHKSKNKPLDVGIITVEIKNETTQTNPRRQSRPGHSKGDLRSRLRHRQAIHSHSCSSDEEDLLETSSTVWSRLDHRVKEEHIDSDDHRQDEDDLRYAVSKVCPKSSSSHRPGFEKNDLRSRLGKKKSIPGSPLRIEVDNEHYMRCDH